MTFNNNQQEQHSAGPQSIGFDYQFYYFILLAIDLKLNQKLGYEYKDDIHIDLDNQRTILYQAKHSTTVNKKNEISSLTNLDSDLWKTLSNWCDFINENNPSEFLVNHSFILVTNKNNNKNSFLEINNEFQNNTKTIKEVKQFLKKLMDSTSDLSIKNYIKKVYSLKNIHLSTFLSKIKIETGIDDIITKIKVRLLEKYYDKELVDPIFSSLFTELSNSKYLEIKEGRKFIIDGNEFSKKYGKCFKIATQIKPLPSRNFPLLLPENIDDQFFLKQLSDIGEYIEEEDKINWTTQMLKFINEFTYWTEEENFVLITEAKNFEVNSIAIWKNEFKSKYRNIKQQIDTGKNIQHLELEIKNLGLELIDYLRKLDLEIKGISKIGIELSNGHFYALSNDLRIGWHYDWENKYKNL